MMLRKILSVSLLLIFCSGCGTSSKAMINRLSAVRIGTSRDDLSSIVGKPYKTEYINPSIDRYEYRGFDYGKLDHQYFWVYLRNDSVVRKSNANYPFTGYAELNDFLDLGLISQEEYNLRHDQLTQRMASFTSAMASMPRPQPQPKTIIINNQQRPRSYTINGPHGYIGSVQEW